jgi:hypothetical protein
MDAHEGSKLSVVGAIKNHWAPRNANIAGRRGCHIDTAHRFFGSRFGKQAERE